jgi:hypothetical protein
MHVLFVINDGCASCNGGGSDVAAIAIRVAASRLLPVLGAYLILLSGVAQQHDKSWWCCTEFTLTPRASLAHLVCYPLLWALCVSACRLFFPFRVVVNDKFRKLKCSVISRFRSKTANPRLQRACRALLLLGRCRARRAFLFHSCFFLSVSGRHAG